MIRLNEIDYEVEVNEKDAIDEEILKESVTDYFNDFDYIVGDWAYGKLRLKGFNGRNNKNLKPINDYSQVNKYIKECCAYGCKYFILKKIEKK